ncbi:MAG: dGTP triphosphohydrolase, partial [Novosphingobium sp.]
MKARFACDPAQSRGREFPIETSLARGPRSAFQRDRDRIVHSIAFRRLRHKTQVFIAPDGDHYRVRLTHSLEVAQIGRVIARALGLDEDLTEALCLAHDIGHPPFGHAGEQALNNALTNFGGFDHNAQCLRVLMRLESPYCEHEGLNLSWEVLEGLAKHNGPLGIVPWALAELDGDYPLELGQWGSLEAQVAALADDIAYDNHDIDDGLRAGFLELEELLTLDFVADQWRAIEHKFPAAPQDRRLRELVRSQIGLMVNDVIGETSGRAKGLGSAGEVRGAGRA